jgi:hypothetical protein
MGHVPWLCENNQRVCEDHVKYQKTSFYIKRIQKHQHGNGKTFIIHDQIRQKSEALPMKPSKPSAFPQDALNSAWWQGER